MSGWAISFGDLQPLGARPDAIARIPGLAVWLWDLRSNRLTWSEAQKDLYGIAADPTQGERDFLDIVHPDDRTRVETEISAFLGGGGQFDHRFRIIRPDGTVRHILDRGVIERDAQGAPLRLFGINIDITAEIEASVAARRAEMQREALVTLGETLRNLRNPADVDVLGAGIVGRSLDLLRSGFAVARDGGREAVIRQDWVRDDGVRRAAGTYLISAYGRFLDPLLRGETVAITDLRTDPRTAAFAPAWAEWGVAAAAFVPLLRNGELVAHMFLHAERPRDWAAADLAFVEAAADRIWAAHEHAAAQRDALAVFNAVDQMIWITRPDGYHERFNERWYEFTGVEPHATDGEAWNHMFHPDDRERTWARWRHSLRTGEPYEIEYRLRHRSGEYRWVLGRAHPVRDANGQILRWYGTCTDIHDAKLKEAELRQATALLELIGDSTPDLIYAKDREGRVIHVNEAATRILGRARSGILGCTDHDFMADAAQAAASLANDRRVLLEGKTIDVDEVHTGVDGVTRTFRSVKAPLRAADGTIVGLVGHSSDVSERRRREERERLLAYEVDHRAKNLLMVVQTLVNLTRGDDATEIREKLLGRLKALSRTQFLLSGSRWEGASVRAMLEEELAPFRVAPGRVSLDGAETSLSPDVAQALSMVFHELATNSAKYGALSAETGVLSIGWARDAATGAFTVEWDESGGPEVQAPAAVRGFGSTLMKTIVERQLKGRFELDWRRTGLRARVCAPSLPGNADEAEG